MNLLGDGTEKPEFGQWSWMSPQEIVDHVSFRYNSKLRFQSLKLFFATLHPRNFFSLQSVDFKKPVYEQVMKAFSPYLE